MQKLDLIKLLLLLLNLLVSSQTKLLAVSNLLLFLLLLQQKVTSTTTIMLLLLLLLSSSTITCYYDIGITFGLAKCGHVIVNRGNKVKSTSGINLSEGQIDDIDESYKYLGILQLFGNNDEDVRGKATSEYRNQVRRFLRSKLSSKNKMTAMNIVNNNILLLLLTTVTLLLLLLLLVLLLLLLVFIYSGACGRVCLLPSTNLLFIMTSSAVVAGLSHTDTPLQQ